MLLLLPGVVHGFTTGVLMEPHVHPIEWEVRLYDEDAKGKFERKEAWIGSMLVRRFGDVAWITMAQDNLDWKVVKKLRGEFLNIGLKFVKWDDGNKIRTLTLRKDK